MALALTGALLFAGCANGDDDATEPENGIENGDENGEEVEDDSLDDGEGDEMAEMEGPFPPAVDCDEFDPTELPSGDDAGEGTPSEEGEFALTMEFGEDFDQVFVARGQQIVFDAETEDEYVDADNAFDSVEVDGTVRSVWPVGDGPHAPVQVRWVAEDGCPYVLWTTPAELDEDSGEWEGGHEPEEIAEYAERF